MNVHVTLSITGKVQGVFYRASAKDKALSLGLQGFAKNEHDGSVSIEVEGEEININAFTDWCRVGPRMADVVEVKVEFGEIRNYKNFLIR